MVAVVTRWFGGTLLGTGGLIRAYGDAVRTALDEVGLLRRILVAEHEIVADHVIAGRLESDLRTRGVEILAATYGAAVTLRVGVPAEQPLDLTALVAELSGGATEPRPVGQSWVDQPPS